MLDWTPNPFITDVERRRDGSLILRPRGELGGYPARTTIVSQFLAPEILVQIDAVAYKSRQANRVSSPG